METKKMGKATELTSRAVFWLHELERRGGGDLVPAPVWGDLKEAGLVTETALPMRMTTGSSYVRLTEAGRDYLARKAVSPEPCTLAYCETCPGCDAAVEAGRKAVERG
jgi:hypothetical protein